jgi:hypothetical protein
MNRLFDGLYMAIVLQIMQLLSELNKKKKRKKNKTMM